MALFYNRYLSGIVIVLTLVTLLVAPALAGKKDNTLTIAWSKEVESLDRYYNTAREGMIISRHICDDLLFRDPVTMEYKPLLAKSYKWINSKTLEFELRHGITFHNGEPFDADDVVFTINYVTNPENKVLVQQNVDWMQKAEKIGPFTVRIHLKNEFPAALEYLSGNVPIYPNEYYAKEGPKGFGMKPIGTGPYKVVEVGQNKQIVFKKNEKYFKDSPKGQPSIGTIIQRTIPEMTSQIAELMTGGVDWIYMVPPDQFENLTKVTGIRTTTGEDMRIAFLEMDTAKRCGETPFAKLEVRRAINHAIDRAAMAKNLVGGTSRVIDTACFPTQFGCDQNVMKYEYNPTKARDLLKKAGYPNGFETDIYGYRDRTYLEAIVGYLREVGIKANLKFMQYSALRDKTYADQTPFFKMTWGSYGMNDMSAITGHYFKFSKEDFARDTQVRDWLMEGDTSVDPKVRKAAYSKALKRIAEQAYWAPLFSYVANYAFTQDLDFTPYVDAVPLFFMSKWK
ncbi:MAG: ABC transporter substrate-binding protein [Desulfobacteraceae bacterium]|nr:MAG: ABC transporter substrate-binding protein [Desulfobacteraceae bacterium]